MGEDEAESDDESDGLSIDLGELGDDTDLDLSGGDEGDSEVDLALATVTTSADEIAEMTAGEEAKASGSEDEGDEIGLEWDLTASGVDMDAVSETPPEEASPAEEESLPDALTEEADDGSYEIPASGGGGGIDPEELNTKFDLAKAFIEMGEGESAKEILEEILEEGDEAAKSRAQEMMAETGA